MTMDPEPKCNILLVDDEEKFARILASRLSVRGFKVETAFSGEEALKMAEPGCFDLIVMDLLMPGMDGLETLRRLRASSCTLPIIMLTGNATVERVVQAIKEGAADFLEKPVDLKVLLDKIVALCCKSGRCSPPDGP